MDSRRADRVMHATYPEGQSLRYRSSTNNEDLPGFNGAGLYDSKTQNPDETVEDGIDKSLKGVFASLWTFRAFTERDFHRIDHTVAAMGVLVHPNYSNERWPTASRSPLLPSQATTTGTTSTLNSARIWSPIPRPTRCPRNSCYTTDPVPYYAVLATSNLVIPGATPDERRPDSRQLARHLSHRDP